MALILARDQLRFTGSSHELEGYTVGSDIPVSLILIEMEPGDGPALHSHPYAEIFVVLEGRATYAVGDREVEVVAGQIVIALPNEPHAFVNSGDGPLRQVDIHCNERFVTEWLERKASVAAAAR
ncbi:MAG: cupin domain-containing protein [Chloroflexota bacterium]|nr:cupin domain-containing protein [Chloroflexota bacterium]